MPIKVTGINLVKPLKLGTQHDVFDGLYLAFKKKGFKHVITDTFQDDSGVRYSLGTAVKGFSFSACSNDPRSREVCLATISHELGHSVFRLKHSGTNLCRDLMDSNILACSGLKDLGFSAAQRLKMKLLNQKRRKNENFYSYTNN
jgi:hypothetical protein